MRRLHKGVSKGPSWVFGHSLVFSLPCWVSARSFGTLLNAPLQSGLYAAFPHSTVLGARRPTPVLGRECRARRRHRSRHCWLKECMPSFPWWSDPHFFIFIDFDVNHVHDATHRTILNMLLLGPREKVDEHDDLLVRSASRQWRPVYENGNGTRPVIKASVV